MKNKKYVNGSIFKARCVFLIGDPENPKAIDDEAIWILNNDKICMENKTVHLDNCKKNIYLEMNHKDLEENFICLDGYPQECKNVSYDCRKCQKALDNCKFRDSFIGNHELETMRYCYCISCKKLGFSCNGKLRSSEDCLKYEGY